MTSERMMPTHLEHVSLTSARTSACAFADVAADRLAEAGALLEAMLARPGLPVPLPRPAGCTAAATVAGEALLVTVHGTAIGRTRGREHSDAVPLALLAVQATGQGAADFWAWLHRDTLLGENRHLATHGLAAPTPPWVATKPLPPLARFPQAAAWLQGLPEALGWVWVRHVAGATLPAAAGSTEGSAAAAVPGAPTDAGA